MDDTRPLAKAAMTVDGRSMVNTDAATQERLFNEGIAALRRNDAAAARAALEQTALTKSLYPLAIACRALGDTAAAHTALDALLRQHPDHLDALLLKGDLLSSMDQRAACAFYQSALANAQRLPTITAEQRPRMERAYGFLKAAESTYEAHLLDRLGAMGIDPSRLPRVDHAIQLLTGKREIFLQRPSSFYFPGLPQIEFFSPDDFDWLARVEDATADIRRELDDLLDDDGAFSPYVATDPHRPPAPSELRDDPRWGASYLWKAGQRVDGNADRCPATMAALAQAPMPFILDRSPMALFSLLQPGTHIKPHHGLLNTRLIVHLPLIAPAGCALRVGSQTRAWEVGKAFVFDDSIEHEAWNRGPSTRVVLLFEIWRPELSADERAALSALFASIPAFTDEG